MLINTSRGYIWLNMYEVQSVEVHEDDRSFHVLYIHGGNKTGFLAENEDVDGLAESLSDVEL